MATTYKVLGQSNPAATTATTLYTVPSAKSAVISSLTVCNQASTAATFRVAVRPAGATLAATVNQGPISKVVVVESADFASHGVPAVADALAQIVKEHSPKALLVASHAFGKEVAARVSVATDSGIITDAVDVDASAVATQ